MTEVKRKPLDGSQREMELWLKAALEQWFETRRADAYLPYFSHFRFAMQPHEILFSIYRALSRSRGKMFTSSAPATKFRGAVANLISEPETYARNYRIYFELLRLGAAIGSHEFLDQVSSLLRQGKLPAELSVYEGEHLVSVNVLKETVGCVLNAGFAGPKLTKFLLATKPYIREDYLDPDTILIELVRNDPDNWAKYAVEFADGLNSQFDRTLLPGEYQSGKSSFAQRLKLIVGDGSYFKGVRNILPSIEAANLEWLVTADMAIEDERTHRKGPQPTPQEAIRALAQVRERPWRKKIGEILPGTRRAA